MSQGIVKWFDQRKGFGFITDQEGQDHFVHFSGLQPDVRDQLKEGQPVIFDAVRGEKGPKAVNVHLGEPAGDAPPPNA